MIVFLWIFLTMRNVTDQNNLVSYFVFGFFFVNHTFMGYVVLIWYNQKVHRCNIIWRITKSRIQIHTQYLLFIAFPRQHWLRERVSMLPYSYFARLVSVMILSGQCWAFVRILFLCLIYVTSVEDINWMLVLCLLGNVFLVDNCRSDFVSPFY